MKKMKCSKKHTLGDVEFFDVTITEKNLLLISEKIALRALKTARAYSCGKLDKLFNCLRYDIYHPHNDPDHIFSDGYDIVQSVAMFLCPHIGKTLASPLCKDKYGNEISLGKAGFRCADRYILKHFRTENSYIARLDDCVKYEYHIEAIDDMDAKQAKTEDITRQMRLTKGEKQVLDCYLAGMTYCSIARNLCVDNTTVWRRRQNMQKKYLAIASH